MCLRQRFLGKVGQPHSYKIPFVAKDRVISDLNMSNGPCRKILHSFELLVDVCITEEGERETMDTLLKKKQVYGRKQLVIIEQAYKSCSQKWTALKSE